MLPLRTMSSASPETRPKGSLPPKARRRKLPIRSLDCDTKDYADSPPFLNETYTSPSEENKDPSFMDLADSTPIVIGTPTHEGRRSTPRLSRHRTIDLSARLTKREGDDFMDLSRHSFVPRNLDHALRAASGRSMDQPTDESNDEDNEDDNASDGHSSDDTRSLDVATLDTDKPYTTVHSSAFEKANVGVILPEVKLTLPQEIDEVPGSPSSRNKHANTPRKFPHEKLSAEKTRNAENDETYSDTSESSQDTIDLTVANKTLDATAVSTETPKIRPESQPTLPVMSPKEESVTPQPDLTFATGDDHKHEFESKPKKRMVHFDLPPLPDLEPIKIQEPDYILDLYETSPTKRMKRSHSLQRLKRTTALDWIENDADTDPRKHDIGAYRKQRLNERLQRRTTKKVPVPMSSWKCRDIGSP